MSTEIILWDYNWDTHTRTVKRLKIIPEGVSPGATEVVPGFWTFIVAREGKTGHRLSKVRKTKPNRMPKDQVVITEFNKPEVVLGRKGLMARWVNE